LTPIGTETSSNQSTIDPASFRVASVRLSLAPVLLSGAIGGTLFALAIGGVVALVVSLTDVRARNAFVFCFVLPMMIAPQVVALAWLQLFGPASPLLKALGIAQAIGARNPLYSPQGIIVVLGVQYSPLVFLTLSCVLNVVLVVGAVAGLGMGVAGAALSTVFSQGVSVTLCLAYVRARVPVLHVRRGDWRLDRADLGAAVWRADS